MLLFYNISVYFVIQTFQKCYHVCIQPYAGIAVLGCWLDDRSSIPGKGKRFPLLTVPRSAHELTQNPIQWVPGALSLRLKRPVHEACHTLPSSSKVKNVELCFMEVCLSN
jgi:hypothetical protein